MAMTVKQLIAKLRKLDPNALVVWRDHDQSVDECNGYVNRVKEAEDELLAKECGVIAHCLATGVVVLSS